MPRKRNEQKEQHENYSKAFPTVMRQLMQTTTQAELAGYLSKTRQSITYYCDGSSSPEPTNRVDSLVQLMTLGLQQKQLHISATIRIQPVPKTWKN